jgi:hypothetical protein
MNRAGLRAFAVAVGLTAPAAAGDDLDWKAAGTPQAPAAAGGDWRPAAAEPRWLPAAPPKAPEVAASAPNPLPILTAPPAVRLPEPAVSIPVVSIPVAPPPTGAVTLPSVLPRGRDRVRPAGLTDADPPPMPLPAPRPVPRDGTPPPAALSAAPPAAPQSAAVWGGYGRVAPAGGFDPLCPDPQAGTPAGPAVPVRHGAFGSENLRLSRDYHVLDAFAGPLLGGDGEKMILGDDAAYPDRGFVSAEYLLWWVRRGNIPVLASTATAGGNGFLGDPDTRTLLGPGRFGSTSPYSGLRVRAGTWLNDANTLGIDGSFFFLGRQGVHRGFSSDQFPTIARPFFNANANREFSQLVSSPGLSTGRLDVDQSTGLYGFDANLRCALICGCDRYLQAFVGYRYLNLRERLSVTETITAGPNAPDPAGTQILVNDTFATRNQFHGGQVGLTGGRRFGRFSLDARASVALGVTHQTLDITGTQVVTRPGEAPQVFTGGGLLAAGPNIGRFTRNHFAVVPEATLNAGYFLTPGLKAFVGYNFLAWTNVIRPGDQIDRTVDVSFVPNFTPAPFVTNRPQPTLRQSDFWAQGVQFGLEARW